MGKPTLVLLTIHATLLSQVAMAHLREQPGEPTPASGAQSVAEQIDRMKRLMDQASSTAERRSYTPDPLLMRSVQFRSCGAGNWWRC
jgi:hypothetical protein